MNNTEIIFVLFVAAIIMASVVGWRQYNQNRALQGYSYYPASNAYIFEESGNTLEDCVAKCRDIPACRGATFDALSNQCKGTYEGKLRSEFSNTLYAWVKPASVINGDNDTAAKGHNSDGEGHLLLAETRTTMILPASQLNITTYIGLQFNMTIEEWTNTEWKTVLYKGTPPIAPINYEKWSDLIHAIDTQDFGVWLAPNDNVMRISVGTHNYNPPNNYIPEHPSMHTHSQSKSHTQTHTQTKYQIEYIDIPDISLGQSIKIKVVIDDRIINVYINDKLTVSHVCDGMPKKSKNNLYILPQTAMKGRLNNIRLFTHPEN